MVTIPIQSVPSQIVSCVLDSQNVQIGIYQKPEGVFVDVNCDGVEVSNGTIAQDYNPLVACKYLGFSGQLVFVDTQGTNDPTYAGFGTRYYLCFLSESEL